MKNRISVVSVLLAALLGSGLFVTAAPANADAGVAALVAGDYFLYCKATATCDRQVEQLDSVKKNSSFKSVNFIVINCTNDVMRCQIDNVKTVPFHRLRCKSGKSGSWATYLSATSIRNNILKTC